MKSLDFTKAGFYTSVFNLTQFDFAKEPEIVFSGKSNSGKSSLINKLCGQRHLARVSSSPGKTASINFYSCGGTYLVDLPGYGFARVPERVKASWARLVEGYFAQGERIKLVVQLVDVRHSLPEDDRRMIAFLHEKGFPYMVCLTKTDKLKKTQLTEQITFLQKEIGQACGPSDLQNTVLPVSSETGEGIGELKNIIAAHL